MKSTNTERDIFNCSIERAFKTPILGDATKILTGYGPIPAVVGFKNDRTWGLVGGARIPIANKGIFTRSGPMGIDIIKARQENKYWQWEVSEIKNLSLFFIKSFTGEWWVKSLDNDQVKVKWRYTIQSSAFIFQPMVWLFTRLLWKKVMQNGIKNIKNLAESEAPYIYDK